MRSAAPTSRSRDAVLAGFLLLSVLACPAAASPAGAASSAGANSPDRARFESDLAAIADAATGEVGIALVDLSSGESFYSRADTPFPQASVIKVCVLLELYRQDQEGKLSLATAVAVRREDQVGGDGVLRLFRPGESRLSLRDLGALMMSLSDNTAANILIERVGMESVNRRLETWGLSRTRLARRMMDSEARRRCVENLSTPREMAALMEKLHGGKLLDAGRTREVLGVMGKVQDSPFSRHLPEGLETPHKDGELEGIRAGAGLLLIPGHPVAWALMTRELRDEAAGEEALARLLRAAYDYFAAR